jgi:hypothetical protein
MNTVDDIMRNAKVYEDQETGWVAEVTAFNVELVGTGITRPEAIGILKHFVITAEQEYKAGRIRD